MPMFAPTVTIDGVAIGSGWNENLTVLAVGAPLSIAWGREQWLDDNTPSTLTVDVIDRDGSWATSNQASGKEIVVTAAGLAAPVLFRGLVGDVDVTVEYRVSPLTGIRERYYRASLICDSHQATVAQAKGNRYAPAVTNPQAVYYSDEQGNWLPLGARRWVSATATTRQDHIDDALKLIGLTATSGYPLPFLPGGTHWHSIIWDDEEVSVWDVYARSVASWPLAVPFYNDTTNQLSYQRPNFDPAVGLTYSPANGVNLSFTPYVGNFAWAASLPVQQIPAGRVSYSETGAALKSGVGSSIDNSQVTTSWLHTIVGAGPSGTDTRIALDTKVDARTVPGRKAGRPGAKTLDYVSDLLETDVPDGVFAATRHYLQDLAPRIATTLSGTNGRFSLPRFLFDFERNSDAPAQLLADLIYPHPVQKTFAITGSEFAGLANVAPAYHIIGGRLTWDGNGWTGEYDTAPTSGAGVNSNAPLTIDLLFGNSPATLADLNPTFQDLALPSIGL